MSFKNMYITILTAAALCMVHADTDTSYWFKETSKTKTYSTESSSNDHTNRVGDISDSQEDKLTSRKKALHQATFGFGGGGYTNFNAQNENYHFYGGYAWEPNANAELTTTLNLTSDFNSNVTALGNVGVNFLPLRTNVSPFFGGSFGLGYVNTSDDQFGFTASGRTGVELFRTSDVQMDIEFVTQVHLAQIDGQNPVLLLGRVGLEI